jgi:hypothetical protein
MNVPRRIPDELLVSTIPSDDRTDVGEVTLFFLADQGGRWTAYRLRSPRDLRSPQALVRGTDEGGGVGGAVEAELSLLVVRVK